MLGRQVKNMKEVDARGLSCPEPLMMTADALKNEKGYFKLFLSDIEYIETINRKVLFHLRSGKKEAGYFKMKDLEERLEQFFFVRCHNGIIVNVDCIESLHDLTVTLYSGNKIYITRSRKQNLMKKMAERGGAV